jgi:ArsR family transcriptional regulator
MEKNESYTCAARTLKAIAHPMRLQILCELNEQEKSVAEIVEASGASQSNVSQHLILLREMGVLNARRDANKVYYSVANSEILTVIRTMRKTYCQNAA